MMINKLAKVISAATVLAMAVSLAPESALAGLGKFPGSTSYSLDPDNTLSDTDIYNLYYPLSVEIDTSSQYISDGVNQGRFTQAIKNATYYQNYFDPSRPSSLNFNVLNFNPADLKIYLIDLTPELLKYFNPTYSEDSKSGFLGKFDSKAVKYEARLEDNSNPKNFINFEFYAPYIAPFTNLTSLSVFNASNLTPFLDTKGQVVFPQFVSDNISENSDFSPLAPSGFGGFVWTPDPDGVTKVPEPVATTGLLGFGIVSAALLRKRNKR